MTTAGPSPRSSRSRSACCSSRAARRSRRSRARRIFWKRRSVFPARRTRRRRSRAMCSSISRTSKARPPSRCATPPRCPRKRRQISRSSCGTAARWRFSSAATPTSRISRGSPRPSFSRKKSQPSACRCRAPSSRGTRPTRHSRASTARSAATCAAWCCAMLLPSKPGPIGKCSRNSTTATRRCSRASWAKGACSSSPTR